MIERMMKPKESGTAREGGRDTGKEEGKKKELGMKF